MLGVAPSPTDTSLVNIGLKTFEIRMHKHAENALAIASGLQDQPQIEDLIADLEQARAKVR